MSALNFNGQNVFILVGILMLPTLVYAVYYLINRARIQESYREKYAPGPAGDHTYDLPPTPFIVEDQQAVYGKASKPAYKARTVTDVQRMEDDFLSDLFLKVMASAEWKEFFSDREIKKKRDQFTAAMRQSDYEAAGVVVAGLLGKLQPEESTRSSLLLLHYQLKFTR